MDSERTDVGGYGIHGGSIRWDLLTWCRTELDGRTAPLAGLVATFVFATQMLNFPVGSGTSGHLVGGALATILVGPWSAIVCMNVG